MSKLLTEWKDFLKKHSNPERAKQEKRYLYSDDDFYGVTSKDYGEMCKKHRKYIKSLNKEEALNLAGQFWAQPSHEEKGYALEIIRTHKEKLNFDDMDWIEKWMRECKGWAFLDDFIIPIMPIILKKDKRAYRYLKKWIKDDDFWVRRSALLAQLLFFRKNEGGDKELFFELAKSQFDEDWINEKYKETEDKKRARFFIRKAIGWTLREMSQKDPDSVFEFLKENKDKMSGLSFREGSRRLPENLRKKLQSK